MCRGGSLNKRNLDFFFFLFTIRKRGGKQHIGLDAPLLVCGNPHPAGGGHCAPPQVLLFTSGGRCRSYRLFSVSSRPNTCPNSGRVSPVSVGDGARQRCDVPKTSTGARRCTWAGTPAGRRRLAVAPASGRQAGRAAAFNTSERTVSSRDRRKISPQRSRLCVVCLRGFKCT